METTQVIKEAFSFVENMDTKEVMRLYYGRIGVMVAFSDDYMITLSGYEGSDLVRPRGVVGHTVDAIVGKKVNTHKLWGHVFRIKGKGGGKFVDNISNISTEDYNDVANALKLLPYLDESVIEHAKTLVTSGNGFSRIWKLTKTIAQHTSGDSDEIWRRILLDLGYSGFRDDRGLGLFTKRRYPAVLLLDESYTDIFDIMPMQKTRTDPRERVNHWVDKFNSYNMAKRNRVAKVRTSPHRRSTFWGSHGQSSVTASSFN